MALFPLIKPTAEETDIFGGIEIRMCTWSVSKCPSKILHSLCCARAWKTSPSCFLIPSKSFFLRYFGIQTTWYLQTHLEWFKLKVPSIWGLLLKNLKRFNNGGLFSFWKSQTLGVPRQSLRFTDFLLFSLDINPICSHMNLYVRLRLLFVKA